MVGAKCWFIEDRAGLGRFHLDINDIILSALGIFRQYLAKFNILETVCTHVVYSQQFHQSKETPLLTCLMLQFEFDYIPT